MPVHPLADICYKLKSRCVSFVIKDYWEDFELSDYGEHYAEAAYNEDDEPSEDVREYYWRIYGDRFLLFGNIYDDKRTLEVLQRKNVFTKEEKEILKEWHNHAFNSLFEVQEVNNDHLKLFDVVAEVPYTVHTNSGEDKPYPELMPYFKPHQLVCSNLVPVRGYWFLSGGPVLFSPEDEPKLFETYIQRASQQSRYRNNPEKLQKAFKLQKEHYDCFIQTHETDELLLKGGEVREKEQMYWDRWYQTHNLPGQYKPPAFNDEFSKAKDVGLVMHEKEGLHHFIDYGKFVKIFSEGRHPQGWRRLVRGYLEDETVPAFVFKRVRDRYPDRFRKVINESVLPIKRNFDPVKHFNALMDRFKHEWRDVYPSVHPLNERFRKYYYQNKDVGRNDPCPCQSGRKYKKCCGR